MFKSLTFFSCLFLFLGTNLEAQSNLAHEVGIITGPVQLRSDFGERNDISTNFGNMGTGIGIVHFLNFSYNSKHETYFNEHFKIRSELSYNTSKLKHYGQWVDQDPNKLGVQQLRAMKGKSSLTNLGAQLEFSPFMKIHDFENTIYSFSPYLSLGMMFSYYKTNVYSTLGQLGTSEVTFPKYLTPSDGRRHGFSNESGGVWSAIGGAGVHFKLSKMSDLLFETRFQYFNSDWIDGLNPNKDLYKENKTNDWQVWYNFGYVFYLD